MKILISGGGTGGHIFPAIAIADALKKNNPANEILFVGAEGKMEMERVPKAGYSIVGLPIRGFQRKLSIQNLVLVFRLLKSLWKAGQIIKSFKPNVVIGVGGYASGPLLRMATWHNVPTIIQEQNSYPGITNKLLSKRANKICVAFDHMQQFFPKEKIVLTGNPVRQDLLIPKDKNVAYAHFNLDPTKKTIGIFGGSLGARMINEAMSNYSKEIKDMDQVQWIWQVGKMYEAEFQKSELAQYPNVKLLAFIDRMDLAYAICDVAVTRAGALTLSELMCTATPSILIPSPNVAEDHQRKNAMALVNESAAEIILDAEAKEKLWGGIVHLLKDENKQTILKINLKRLAKPHAAEEIAKVVESIATK